MEPNPAVPAIGAVPAEKPLGRAGGFQLIFKNRYLLLIAVLVLLSNCVSTTGESILGKTVSANAAAVT